jgi:hypothetical protein
MSSEKEQLDIVREAVLTAALDSTLSIYDLTIRDLDYIAFTIDQVMINKGFVIIKKEVLTPQ